MSIKFFGQFLLERGKIIKEELLDAIEFQRSINVKLGTIALDAGYLTAEQIERVHAQQQRTDKMFGEIALELKLLTPEQLEELLIIQKNERISLGDALLQKGYLTLSDLEAELSAYKKEQEAISAKACSALDNLKNPNVANIFLELTIKLLRRLSDIEVDPIASHNDKDRIAPYMWNIYQRFVGDINGTYIISVTDEPLLKIASHIAQEKMWEVDDFAKDALKEFVNIVVGNSISKLSQENIKIDLHPSKVVTSLGHIEISKESTETIAVTLADQSYKLQMSLVYSPLSVSARK